MVRPGQTQHQHRGLLRGLAEEGLNLFETAPQSDPRMPSSSIIFLASLKSLPIAIMTP
jgi:hypothetical protein